MIKPGAAGIKMMPEKANKQLFEQLRSLGVQFSKSNQFDKALIRQLEIPIVLSSNKIRMYNILSSLRFMDIMWFVMLKQNHAFQKRRDRPLESINKHIALYHDLPKFYKLRHLYHEIGKIMIYYIK